MFIQKNMSFNSDRVKETTDKKKCYFFIGGPLFFFYKRQSEAIHYYESFFAISDDPGYEMSRRVGELPRSGFVVRPRGRFISMVRVHVGVMPQLRS